MGMEFRPYYMAREWVKAGHSVTIVAGDYSHLRIKNPEVQRDFQEEMIDGIRYAWVKTGEYEGNGAARAFTMFRFVRKLKAHASVIARDWKPDVVIASSTYPLDTYAAQKIAKLAGAKLIHEIHDMWPATLYEIGGMSKSHPFVKLMQAAEDSFCKHSDKVVSILPGAKDYLVSHGMKPDAFVAIPNGVIESEWEDSKPLPDEHAEAIKHLKREGKFVICFFGSHTVSYGIDCLIDAVQALPASSNVVALFVGDGIHKPNLIEHAKREHQERFVFLRPVPKKAVPSLLAEVDGIYIGLMKNNLGQFGIGMNKLFDSMMASKPILYAVEAYNNYVDEYNCGISVASEDANAVADGLMFLSSMPERERQALGENGRKAIRENFTYEVLANRFLEAMR